ncbi:uncharacterized protein [Rutidosis leptorrhynchoides]|uniref:uncharacterized protein n=1 Tax=Rutidosis leptorrhynchoides TaxID=125765 RepID=UPI003A98E35B
MRQLAYGTTTDMFDEYLQMAEELYVDEYLRKSTSSDIARLYSAHEEKHGFKGMLGSIDCMHWKWKNCANNDVNVLNQSSLFDDIKNGNAPFAPFTVNGNEYTNGYYLTDCIYPNWLTLMKAYSTPTDEPHAKFKRFQDSARKDVERTFGILQVEDNGFNISWLEKELLRTNEANPNYVRNRSRSRDVREQEIRDRNIHDQLRNDLTEHIWALPPNFRSLNA